MRAVTLKCRSWGCPECQPDRKKRLIAFATAGPAKVFITITVNPAVGEGPIARARGLVKAWRLIVKRAKVRYGIKHIGYLCVMEATKAGEPHLHILADVAWLDQKWLSRQMREIAEAPIVDIRKVRSAKQIANYLAKYIGKAPHRFGTLKRYWATRGWDPDPFKPEPLPGFWSAYWLIVGKTLDHIEADLRFQGYNIDRRGNHIHAWGDVPLWGQPRGLCCG